MDYQEMAIEWRKIQGYLDKGGVVIICDSEVQGWVNELRNPDHWVPRSLAIDIDGNCWIARGGDDQNGADTWTLNGLANNKSPKRSLVFDAARCLPGSKCMRQS